MDRRDLTIDVLESDDVLFRQLLGVPLLEGGNRVSVLSTTEPILLLYVGLRRIDSSGTTVVTATELGVAVVLGVIPIHRRT